MPIDQTKLRLGPANLYLTEGGSPVNIGFVDKVDIQFAAHQVPLMGGQAGSTPVDKVVTGVEGTVSFVIQQIELVGWRRALLGNSQSFQGVTTPANHRLEIQAKAGQSLFSLARLLTVAPIFGGVETTNIEEKLSIPFAVPDAETVGAMFDGKAQAEIKCKYYMLPDATKRYRIAYWGDDGADTSAAGTW